MDSSRKDTQEYIIDYTAGNILKSNCQCIVVPVNTVGVMGAGLALQFKRLYPQMFTTYREQCISGNLSVGRVMFYNNKLDGRIICLLPTKRHWRELSQLEYIESGLKAFRKYYTEWNITDAAFPKLGCGLGGLDWENHVKPLMEEYLGDLSIPIEIYE